MLKDLNLGRYYPTSSVLHSLDPRTKITFLLIYIISVFFANTFISIGYTLLVLCLLIWLSKAPLKFMFRGFKTIIFIVALADLINILTVKNGVFKAFIVTVRMAEIVLSSNLLTLTTKPKDIADGLEKSLSFLKALKVPVHDLATMLAIAVRFIPILNSEANRIMMAQEARGADFETRNLVKKAKSLISILIPLFISAFKKADELALAMDSRLYGTGTSSRLHPLKYTCFDVLGFILTAEYVAILAFWRVLCL